MLKHQPKKGKLSGAINIARLNDESSQLSELWSRAGQLLNLTELFRSCIDPKFKALFSVNSLEDGTLTITCTSASIATRFRMKQTETIEQLNQKSGDRKIEKIAIRIRPERGFKKLEQSQRTISRENADLLADEACATEDAKLREALLRLANRAESGSD